VTVQSRYIIPHIPNQDTLSRRIQDSEVRVTAGEGTGMKINGGEKDR
jgi:hypothetical protein